MPDHARQSGFDPYHKWLGIPAFEQPPNHYRLLGLTSFESDPDAIESAADQRMAHVRTFQSSMHSAESQRLLNELASAKLCLLNADRKYAYGSELYIIKNEEDGLADILRFDTRAQDAAEAMGAREIEVLALEITNSQLHDVLLRGGFSYATMPAPEELGGGTFEGLSRIQPVL